MDVAMLYSNLRDCALIGVGATLLLDLWAIVRRALFGIPLPDYRLLGRWLGHMPRGRFRHASIRAAAAVRAEHALGWLAHYLIGMIFAALLPAFWGEAWLHSPSLWPALIVGLGSVAAPFLLMHPGMGAGAFSRLAPRPTAVRLQSLGTHLVFGFALFAAGHVLRLIHLL